MILHRELEVRDDGDETSIARQAECGECFIAGDPRSHAVEVQPVVNGADLAGRHALFDQLAAGRFTVRYYRV